MYPFPHSSGRSSHIPYSASDTWKCVQNRTEQKLWKRKLDTMIQSCVWFYYSWIIFIVTHQHIIQHLSLSIYKNYIHIAVYSHTFIHICVEWKAIDRYRRPASCHNIRSVFTFFLSFLISQISQSLSNQQITTICCVGLILILI